MTWKYRITRIQTETGTPPDTVNLALTGEISLSALVFDDATGTPPTRSFTYSWQGRAPQAGTLAAFRTELEQRLRAQADAYTRAKDVEAAAVPLIGVDRNLP